MMATTVRMRVVGESFRLMNGVEEMVKVYLLNNGGICRFIYSIDVEGALVANR